MTRKHRTGDVFYIPLPLDAKYTENYDGHYISSPKDKITVGQVIWSNYNCYIAIFNVFATVDSIDINKLDLSAKNVVFLYPIIGKALATGWWPIIGNKVVAPQMPMQAYAAGDEAFDYKFNDDQSKGYCKKVNKRTLQKLHQYGTSSSDGVILSICQYYFGITPKLFDFSNKEAKKYLEKFIPKKEGCVWKIFPEHYDNIWIEKE